MSWWRAQCLSLLRSTSSSSSSRSRWTWRANWWLSLTGRAESGMPACAHAIASSSPSHQTSPATPAVNRRRCNHRRDKTPHPLNSILYSPPQIRNLNIHFLTMLFLLLVLVSLLLHSSQSFSPAISPLSLISSRSTTSSFNKHRSAHSSSSLQSTADALLPGTAPGLDWDKLGFEFRETKSHLRMVYKVRATAAGSSDSIDSREFTNQTTSATRSIPTNPQR
jgi:hypothetical protein